MAPKGDHFKEEFLNGRNLSESLQGFRGREKIVFFFSLDAKFVFSCERKMDI